MNDVIKRVADAMKSRASQPVANLPSLERVLVGSLGDTWPYLARAAIEAMREPINYIIGTPEGNRVHALLRPAQIEACRQTNCSDRGFDESDCGHCATCADMADFVGEAYWRAMIAAILRDETTEGENS